MSNLYQRSWTIPACSITCKVKNVLTFMPAWLSLLFLALYCRCPSHFFVLQISVIHFNQTLMSPSFYCRAHSTLSYKHNINSWLVKIWGEKKLQVRVWSIYYVTRTSILTLKGYWIMYIIIAYHLNNIDFFTFLIFISLNSTLYFLFSSITLFIL